MARSNPSGTLSRYMSMHTRAVRALVASLTLTWAVAAHAQAPSNQDLIGTWNLTMTSPQGSHPTTLTIREEGGQLAGNLSGLPGPSPVAVKTSETGVTLSFSVDYQGQAVPVVMSGKVTGSDIRGTVDYAGGAAGGDFSGSKAAATASSAAGDSSLTGTWDITGDNGGGYSFKLTQEGTAVSGILRTPDGAEVPVKGTFENGALTLAVSTDSMSGTIKGARDGAALKGTYDIGGNAGSWSATRKP